MAMGQINRTVPEADVIITNPTHYAVALKYDPKKAEAPYIVAKGMDDIALHIRDVARHHQIEVVEFPPLARAVYHTTRRKPANSGPAFSRDCACADLASCRLNPGVPASLNKNPA
ncbi:Flagellar biosynthesis protein FlhB [Enterobacter cancerogenus]|uniref:Flagellar biosynthetic protein FlhB n=1 Tax=Enterobacter cancerogenus TaxID=69218 RepID=A0A484XU84_9ENTR|nr:Flagellar biosynthesis protein FlhB [Enterobacter cancerogenus]